VHGHTAADPDAEGRDLALGLRSPGLQPHPAPAGHPRRVEVEVGADRDQGLLDPAYVVDDQHVVGEPDDGVADQLTGAVERDQSAAVDVDDRRAAGVDRPVAGRRALAGRERGWVLEEPDGVGALACHDPRVDLALGVPRGEVVDGLVAETALTEHQVAHPIEPSAAPTCDHVPRDGPVERARGDRAGGFTVVGCELGRRCCCPSWSRPWWSPG
jgi:hypothetical protein